MALLCGLGALLLYWFTAAPGIVWQDPAMHQYRILTHQLENPLGLALSHPLHHWLGRFAISISPLSAPLTLNMLSGLFGALGVALVGATLQAMTRKKNVVYLATATLAFSLSYWQMSVVTESYTLAAALMALEWWLLFQYSRSGRPGVLAAIFAVNGLHVANHLLGLLTLATYGILALERLWRGRLPARWFFACLGLWCLGASPYLLLVASFGLRTGDWLLTLRSALVGGNADPGSGYAGDVFNFVLSWSLIKLNIFTLGYNFPSLAGPIVLVGFFRRTRGRGVLMRNVLLAQTALICGFVMRYPILDQYTFYVPVCALMGLWFGLGVDQVTRWAHWRRTRRWLRGALIISPLMQMVFYLTFPPLAASNEWLKHLMRDLPYRDEYRFFFEPWKHGDDSAERYARAVLALCRPGDVVMGTGTTAYPVVCSLRVYGGPADVDVFAWRLCTSDPEFRRLNRDEILATLARGGRVLVLDEDWAGAWLLESGTDLQVAPYGGFWELLPRNEPAVR